MAGQVGEQDVEGGAGDAVGAEQAARGFFAEGVCTHRCSGAFGVDAVDAYTVFGPFVGQGLSEVDGGGLGGGVKAVVGPASGVGTGGVQQQLSLRLGEVGKSGAGDVDRCEIVDPKGFFDGLWVRLVESADAQGTGGVNDGVDLSGRRVGLLQCCRDMVGVGHVGACRAAGVAEDSGAVFFGQIGHTGPDAVTTTEDDHGLAVEFTVVVGRIELGCGRCRQLEQFVG